MSQSDVEGLRARYEAATSKKNPGAAFADVHSDFELKTVDRVPGAGTYRGAEAATQFFADLVEPFAEVSYQPQEFFEHGDQIVVFLTVRFHPRGSSAVVENQVGALWTMRDGKPARCEMFAQREQALEAAGISPSGRVMTERTHGLDAAVTHAQRFLRTLDERPVGVRADAAQIRSALGGPLPYGGEDPEAVIDALAAGAEPGIVASAGPRHFGFVIGGALPAALAADWLVSAWDQCAAFHSLSPAAAAIEEIAAAWILDLLGLPASASVGFVTGGQGANTTALAAARHAVLARAGWDVERDGLIGAPGVNLVCGEQAHATIYTALRLLGLGEESATRVPADAQGRIDRTALQETLAGLDGPTIVCAQAGNVATGAFDPLEPIADDCAARGAWLHVDGAFGLWAAAAPSTRALLDGVERADSWAVDAHKWLNVPYDGAMAIVADADAHRAAMSLAASYLVGDAGQRDSTNYVPESSRRARAVPIYAALRSLGRSGVSELVERNCAHARRMAAHLAEMPGAEVLNDVVLNQVLVRFAGGDEANRAVVTAVQREGTCWLGGTQWNGRAVVRLSFSNWATSHADVDRSAAAIAAAVAAIR
jgi:glutamate/tyrosine decarboxylase-like PLP-dependent enzyme/ketosteroid isomerase-like protein